MTRLEVRLALGFVAAVAVLLFAAPNVAAQEASTTTAGLPRSADVGIEVGDFDDALGDWPVTAVSVTGEIDEGVVFTVTLKGSNGVLWTGSAEYTEPLTTLPVTGVGVGEVVSAELGSTLVLGQLILPELEDQLQGGGGSTGQVATSMALVIIVAVILFRTPLPAAATQRWTK